VSFRPIRDRDTGDLVIEYDARADKLRYINERGEVRTRSLYPLRREVKEREQGAEARREPSR
jgi:hypothetical protein